MQQINDILQRFDERATILSIVDQNIAPATQLQLIADQFKGVLPAHFEFRLELKSFSTKNKAQCRVDRNFSACLQEDFSASNGPSTPANKEVTRRRMVFVKKRPPENCSLEAVFSPLLTPFYSQTAGSKATASFLPGPLENQKNQFRPGNGSKTIFFQGASTDSNISFNVDVNGTSFSCDEHTRVDLNAVIFGERPPIDLVLVIDRSGSMSWSGMDNSGSADSLWLDGNYAFNTYSFTGFADVNVTNPLLPRRVRTIDPGSPVDLHGDRNSLFVIETLGTDELIAYDINNPTLPVERGRIAINGPVGVFTANNYVFVAVDLTGTANDILRIVDASNKSSMALRGSINLSGANDVFVAGNTAYITRGSAGLSAVNITDVNNPQLLGTIATGGTAEGVFVQGTYAYVAMGSAGVASVNASNPSSMTVASVYDTQGNARNLFAMGNSLVVADETAVQVLNISNPDSIAFDRNFASPFDYDDVHARGIYAYLASSLGLITVDIVDGPRINNAKVATHTIIDFNGWRLPPDQLGLVSFSTLATLNQQLTTDKNLVKNAVNALVANGATFIEGGIRAATTELTSARGNPNALRFQVLLTDGQQTFGDALAAAHDANDQNIIIYTVGFGEDADETLLREIARITDGNYYYVADKNALKDVFELIAKEVGLVAQEQAGAIIRDVTINAPVTRGALVLDKGDNDVNSTETIVLQGDKNFVRYGIIPKISNIKPWRGFYVMTMPCNSEKACDSNTILAPDGNTRFSYKDFNGIDKNTDLNKRISVSFQYRDLTVKVPAAATSGFDVLLDINAINSGFLSTPSTTVNVCKANSLWNCIAPSLRDLNVPAFVCGEKSPGCPVFNRFFDDEVFQDIFGSPDEQARVKLEINKNRAIRECPTNNVVKLNCSTKGNPQYYVLDLFWWLR